MAGDLFIRPPLNPLGVRIVLDLSDFGVRPERRLQCVYLSHDKFTTIKDLKRHVKRNVLKTDAKIQLFLKGNFWVPNSESILVFQNDDVVAVRTKFPSPCTTSPSSESSRRLQPKLKNGKSPSVESGSETESVKRQQKKGKSSQSNSSMDTSDSDSSQGQQKKKLELPRGHQSLTSASLNKQPSTKNLPEIARESPSTSRIESVNPKAAHKRAAPVSSSESETDSHQPETSTTTQNKETPEVTKRKRKRQRKPKNKNKIPNSESEPPLGNQLGSQPNAKEKVIASTVTPVQTYKTFGSNKKVYFDDSDDENPATPSTQTRLPEIQSSPLQPVVVASRSLDPGSNHVSCEEAMLVGLRAQKKGPIKSTNKQSYENGNHSSVKSPIVIASRNVVNPPPNKPLPTHEELDVTYENATSFPILKELPRIGMHMAFKILTMSSDYSPGVSDYIFGVVVSTDGFSIFLRITHDENPVEVRSGKFEFDEENEDDLNKIGKIFEYKWQDMIEPRHVEPKPH